MIGSSAKGSDFESAFRIPSQIAINNVKLCLVVDVLYCKTFNKVISGSIYSDIELIPLNHFLGEKVFGQSRVFGHSFGLLPRVSTEGTVRAHKWLFGKDINRLSEHKGIFVYDRDARSRYFYLGLKTALLGTMLTALMALRCGSIEMEYESFNSLNIDM